jgi:hypothetical protein
MAQARKSWREKLADKKDLPKVGPVSGKRTGTFGEGLMLVPAPAEVDAVMAKVPAGKLITVTEIRDTLARKHEADVCCPLATGIFAWIAAHAADEAATEGEQNPTPYWRTLKTGGELNPKYPGGIPLLKERLESEGHRVVQRGKRWFVEGYEESLC